MSPLPLQNPVPSQHALMRLHKTTFPCHPVHHSPVKQKWHKHTFQNQSIVNNQPHQCLNPRKKTSRDQVMVKVTVQQLKAVILEAPVSQVQHEQVQKTILAERMDENVNMENFHDNTIIKNILDQYQNIHKI